VDVYFTVTSSDNVF